MESSAAQNIRRHYFFSYIYDSFVIFLHAKVNNCIVRTYKNSNNLWISEDCQNDCSIQGQAHDSDEAQVDRCQQVGPSRHQGVKLIITDVRKR